MKNIHVPVAMALTGHKTTAVFQRYDIVVEQDLREGVERLARLRQGGGHDTITAQSGRRNRLSR